MLYRTVRLENNFEVKNLIDCMRFPNWSFYGRYRMKIKKISSIVHNEVPVPCSCQR